MSGGMTSRLDGMFNPENKFWMFMEKVMNAVILGLLWLVCSLPLITMGAATAAVFQFMLRQVRDEEGYIWKSFFKAFRQNFRQATVLWMGEAAVGGFLAYDIYLCTQIQVSNIVRGSILIVLGCLSLMYLLTAIYILPLLACFHVTVKQTVHDAFIMAVGNLPVSLAILAVYAGFTIFAIACPEAAGFCAGLAMFVSSYFFHFVFRRYMKHQEMEEAAEESERQ